MDNTADFAMGYTMGDRNNCGYGNGWGGMFGGEGMWLFALLLLPMMWGGGFGGFGNRNGQPVTEAGLCNAMNFNNLENAVGRLSDNQSAIARQTDNAICNLGYSALQQTNETQRQLADCCCTTQRAIDGVNYNAAMNTAAINANTTAGIQKVLDKMCENETNALRSRVQQLELQSALCGVVRYPLQTTYATNCNPFFGGWNNGCGCCNGNI